MADKGIAVEEVQDNGRDCQEHRDTSDTFTSTGIRHCETPKNTETKYRHVLGFLEYRKIPEKHCNSYRGIEWRVQKKIPTVPFSKTVSITAKEGVAANGSGTAVGYESRGFLVVGGRFPRHSAVST